MYFDVLEKLRNTADYDESASVLQYLSNVIKNQKKVPESALDEVMRFAIDEMKRLIGVIPTATTYKKKDEIFNYEDKLLMAYTIASGKTKNTQGIDEDVEVIRQIVELISKETIVEDAVDEVFELKSIAKEDIDKVIEIVKPIDEVYWRGKFFYKLLENASQLSSLPQDVKVALADFTVAESEKLLSMIQLDDDAANILELIADLSKHFMNEKLLKMIERIMNLKQNNIRYYALETLLSSKHEVSPEAVQELAQDVVYADMVHDLLLKYNKINLFPKELENAEYLAKSNMVHWLTYPTELGKKPDDIQLLGTTTIKGDCYYIFKYISDSDTLDESTRNKWLIGWVSLNENSTFSEFDLLADFEGKDLKKTLKKITKRIKKIEF